MVIHVNSSLGKKDELERSMVRSCFPPAQRMYGSKMVVRKESHPGSLGHYGAGEGHVLH